MDRAFEGFLVGPRVGRIFGWIARLKDFLLDPAFAGLLVGSRVGGPSGGIVRAWYVRYHSERARSVSATALEHNIDFHRARAQYILCAS